MASQQPFILFLTGVSGVGKTTVTRLLAKRNPAEEFAFLEFDSIGVPSLEEMVRQYGSSEHWQEATAHRWVENILLFYARKKLVILDGQVNPDYLTEACGDFGVTRYGIVLLDCDWDTLRERLVIGRGQAELVNAAMRNWLWFLRAQAKRKGIPIVNTAHQTPEQTVEFVQTHILNTILESL